MEGYVFSCERVPAGFYYGGEFGVEGVGETDVADDAFFEEGEGADAWLYYQPYPLAQRDVNIIPFVLSKT